MSNLFVQETALEVLVDDERRGLGEGDVYETGCDNPGDLFRAMQACHGRCVGKMFVGDGKQIGWVFLTRETYSDSPGTYLRETWVSVHTGPDTVTREPHYAPLR